MEPGVQASSGPCLYVAAVAIVAATLATLIYGWVT